MPDRRKTTVDIRELVLQMRQSDTDRAVQRATGMHRQTVKRYRSWAATQGLLVPPISAILTIRHSEYRHIRKESPMQTFTLHVAQRGLVTLPQELRKAHNIRPGQEMTLLDLDGVFVLSQQPSQVDALADRIADELGGRGETLASMLQTLREVRAEYA